MPLEIFDSRRILLQSRNAQRSEVSKTWGEGLGTETYQCGECIPRMSIILNAFRTLNRSLLFFIMCLFDVPDREVVCSWLTIMFRMAMTR